MHLGGPLDALVRSEAATDLPNAPIRLRGFGTAAAPARGDDRRRQRETARHMVEAAAGPMGAQVVWCMGNHDERRAFRSALPSWRAKCPR